MYGFYTCSATEASLLLFVSHFCKIVASANVYMFLSLLLKLLQR